MTRITSLIGMCAILAALSYALIKLEAPKGEIAIAAKDPGVRVWIAPVPSKEAVLKEKLQWAEVKGGVKNVPVGQYYYRFEFPDETRKYGVVDVASNGQKVSIH